MDERYKRIVKYAEENGIDLNSEWIVWCLQGATPLICCHGERRGFDDSNQVFEWARQHVNLKNLVVTGPGDRRDFLDDSDRVPQANRLRV